MIDRELRAAESFMRDADRQTFAARSVEHASSPEAFAANVRTSGWEPVNVAPKIGNVARVIANLGGEALYGDRPDLVLRELIQNAADAVRALRALGSIDPDEGKIEVALSHDGDTNWLHVTDTGVGMSRFVLTEVLLDFGNSLWRSESLLSEHSGLAAKNFKAVGQFGIGFFSVFMLGKRVQVITRRYRRVDEERSDQWLLEFHSGLDRRPTLRRPGTTEELLRSGTRVSVAINDETLSKLLASRDYDRFNTYIATPPWWGALLSDGGDAETARTRLPRIVANLCPTLDILVWTQVEGVRTVSINPNDWTHLAPDALISRLYLNSVGVSKQRLIDLREESGLLVGRVGYDGGYFSHAIATHHGIKSGILLGVVGVVLGHNNLDLVRNTSMPLASRAAWARWAREWVDSAGHMDIKALASIHPLIPDRDLPVFMLNDSYLTAAELSTSLQSQTEVLVCEQPSHHDVSDQVSADRFEEHLRTARDILFFPSLSSEIANRLGFPPIKYIERIESLLRTEWGSFQASAMDEVCVGNVTDVEITRDTIRYTR
jgi:hypothetical protein